MGRHTKHINAISQAAAVAKDKAVREIEGHDLNRIEAIILDAWKSGFMSGYLAMMTLDKDSSEEAIDRLSKVLEVDYAITVVTCINNNERSTEEEADDGE